MFSVGDLVEITFLGSELNGHRALVTDVIHYNTDLKELPNHPDEYSCVLQLLSAPPGHPHACVQRAKWLKLLSKIT